MTNEYLPQKIEPILLANKGASFKGALSLKQLPRLSEQLCEQDGEVEVTLLFGKDHKKIYFIKGNITAELSLPCQRCLEPVSYKINIDFNLSPIRDNKIAETLPDHYDPVLLIDKTLLLAELVEEEIILNLPMVAKHDLDVCSMK